MGFLESLTVFLIALKLAGALDAWSWLAVLAPLLFAQVFYLLLVILWVWGVWRCQRLVQESQDFFEIDE